MGTAFWQSSKTLLRYKGQLALALVGALISAMTLGSAIGMLLPTIQLLLKKRDRIQDAILHWLQAHPDAPQWSRDLMQWAADHLPRDQYLGFIMVMAGFVLLSIIGSLGKYLHEYLTITVSSKATMIWRNQVYTNLIRVPALTVGRSGYSDMVSRLINDTRILADGIQAVIGRTLNEVLRILTCLGMAFWLDWRVATMAILGGAVIGLLFRVFGRKIRRASKQVLGGYGKMTGTLSEALGGLATVKVHNAEAYEVRRFRRMAKAIYTAEMKMRAVKAYSSPLVETLGIIGIAMIASIFARQIFQDKIQPDRLLAVLATLAIASAGLKPLSSVNNTLHESAAAAERLGELLDLESEPLGLAHREGTQILPRHRREIVFENVSFRYPGQDRSAVVGVNLRVLHGQTVAVVGTNGSGKTTLLSMLTRLLVPEKGRVLIDGKDIQGVNLRSLRKQVAVVSQQSVLFEDTIANNIAYGRRHESMARIQAAAEAAYADDFISATPQGYQTKLGEDGTGLSGGQRQRLCIARAMLRDPAILILDEATSQIDADSEAKINRAMSQFRHGRTTFVIAHRLSTVIHADMIVVMEDGRVVDQGTHAELLERCPAYKTLTDTQLQPSAA